jgi:hypothetical protein
MGARRWILLCAAALLPACGGGGGSSGGGGGGGLPSGLPTHFSFGLGNGPGSIGWMNATASWGYRYQYLSGGANTGSGWSTWNNPAGNFALYYMQDSRNNGYVPVLTYYQIVGSTPNGGSEDPASKFDNASTMNAYYADFKLLMQKAAEFGHPVIVHVEPDLWGHCQNAISSNPSAIPVHVASSGHADVSGLPNTLAGFARALVRLRDQNAPNAILGWHASHWAAGADLILNAADPVTHADATAAFYLALGAGFDVLFHDPSDRDAGFKQAIYGDGGASWWDASDFTRYRQYLARMHLVTGLRGVLWQVPCGNTLYLSCNNSWGHYQDNRAQYFLQSGNRANIEAYAAAGVIAVLFGSTDAGTTSYLDAQGDGITNPSSVGGTSIAATTSDDDGGFLRSAADVYFDAGPVPLP